MVMASIIPNLDRDVPLLQAGALLILTLTAAYVVYQRYFHPIAKYPGPFLASLTYAYKFYFLSRLRLHDKLAEWHDYYGPVVRVGPNDLHFRSNDAVASIYKGGRKMVKTDFYDAFTAFQPNVFGTRNDDLHALRRRQMAHAFSQKNISDMEVFIDDQLRILCENIKKSVVNDTTFDLGDYIARYILDVLGEVAYSRSFESQHFAQKSDGIPAAVHNHFLQACIIGNLPFQSFFKSLAARSPVPWMRQVVEGRAHLKDVCRECVAKRKENSSDRKDLLGSLIKARDPETGAMLSEPEVNSEAFAMLVAGSHTTAGTLTCFFWELMHHPKCMANIQAELDQKLGNLPSDYGVRQLEELESKLPYTAACVQENFRKSPVVSMSLWRAVAPPEGADIGGYFVPKDTKVAVSNFVQHHDPTVWGPDHDQFDPSRWFDDRAKGKENLLLPFSVGHRMCIGKNLAMTNIYKTVTTLLSLFEFELVEVDRELEPAYRNAGIGGLDKPVLCKASLRSTKS